jgi:hypothetical protein
MKRVLGLSIVAIVLGAILSAAAQERRMRVPQLQTPITAKYLELGADRSVLGTPQGDERPTPDGVGRYRHFERGSIYWSPSTGAHEVHGLIRQKWAELGWERSFLGYPTSDETPLPNRAGAFSQFQRGAIYWYAANNAIEVKKAGEAAPLLPPPPPPSPSRSAPQASIADSARAMRESARAVAPSGSVPVVLPATEPGPIGKGNAEGSLNDTSWSNFPQCAGSVPPAVEAGLKLLGTVLNGLGASAPTLDRRCGTYTREIASGVTLGAPFGATSQPPTWSYLGGRGDLMADSLLCLLKDIGDRPDGRIENRAAVPVGIGKVELRQIVGLSKFDPAAKRAELFQVTKICAPLLGCLDAGRQNIVATVRASTPAWPSGMRAGDYGIANSYGVEIVTDWSAVKAGASLPPITVITPYGQVSAKPQFSYATNLLPVDSPYSYKKGSQVQFHFPDALSVANETVQDTYGRSGVPFVLNVESHLPAPPPSLSPQTPGRPAGWSSQLGLGGRDGSPNAQIWNPSAGSVLPFRPDLDFGKARSELERLPAASFVAKAPVRFEPPNPKSLLPASVQSILSGVELWVEVTPAFLADYAAQFEIFSREARLTYGCLPRQGEFGRTCGVAEAALALQATASAHIQITGTVHLKLSFIGVGPFSPPDINVTKSFTVPLPSPDRAWDPDHIENVQEAHQSSRGAWAIHAADKVGGTLWQGVKGLSGATSGNIPQWTNACLATPPKHPAPIPAPSHEPGTGDDLMPELLPCNICVADIRQTQYNPFLVFEVKNRKPGLPASVCEWQENAGCYDLCSWNGSSWNRVEMAASQVVGQQCATPRPPIVK